MSRNIPRCIDPIKAIFMYFLWGGMLQLPSAAQVHFDSARGFASLVPGGLLEVRQRYRMPNKADSASAACGISPLANDRSFLFNRSRMSCEFGESNADARFPVWRSIISEYLVSVGVRSVTHKEVLHTNREVNLEKVSSIASHDFTSLLILSSARSLSLGMSYYRTGMIGFQSRTQLLALTMSAMR